MMDLMFHVSFQLHQKRSIKYGIITIFKLKQNDITGELLDLLCDFLRNRKQRVLNEQVST